MRMPILTLLMVMTVAGAFCQPFIYRAEVTPLTKPLTYPKYKPKNLVRDTLILQNLHQGLLDQENVKLVPQKPQKYIGNNGDGSDIYQDQLDNMYLLKPDKSFSSTMPNALNQVLLADSVSMQPRQIPRIYRSPKPTQ